MKPTIYILSTILLLLFAGCDNSDSEQPTGVSARINGAPWSTYSIEVSSDVDGLTIHKLVATGEGDDHRKITFWFDRLGLTQSNRTTSFRSRGASLNSFNYQILEGDFINLVWQTANETNLYYFQIEWSADNVNFNYLDIVYAQGNSSTPFTYENLMNMNLQDGQVIFIRLMLVDYDGNTSYSPTLSVTSTFPVSITDEFGIRRNAYNGNIQLTEFDTKEKILSGTFYFTYKNQSGVEVPVTEGKLNKIRF